MREGELQGDGMLGGGSFRLLPLSARKNTGEKQVYEGIEYYNLSIYMGADTGLY